MKYEPSKEAAQGRGNAPGPGASSMRKHLWIAESLPQSRGEGDGSSADVSQVAATLQTLSSGDVARLFGRSERTIRRLRASGQLVGTKIGRTWRYSVLDVRAFMNDRRSAGEPSLERAPGAGRRPMGGS